MQLRSRIPPLHSGDYAQVIMQCLRCNLHTITTVVRRAFCMQSKGIGRGFLKSLSVFARPLPKWNESRWWVWPLSYSYMCAGERCCFRTHIGSESKAYLTVGRLSSSSACRTFNCTENSCACDWFSLISLNQFVGHWLYLIKITFFPKSFFIRRFQHERQ